MQFATTGLPADALKSRRGIPPDVMSNVTPYFIEPQGQDYDIGFRDSSKVISAEVCPSIERVLQSRRRNSGRQLHIQPAGLMLDEQLCGICGGVSQPT